MKFSQLLLEAEIDDEPRLPSWAAGARSFSAAYVGAEVHAAVALQSLLDEEMGGWPNTFG